MVCLLSEKENKGQIIDKSHPYLFTQISTEL